MYKVNIHKEILDYLLIFSLLVNFMGYFNITNEFLTLFMMIFSCHFIHSIYFYSSTKK